MPRLQSIGRKDTLIALVIIIVTVVVSWLLLSRQETTKYGASRPDCAADFRCNAEYYARLTYRTDPATAFIDIRKAYEEDNNVKAQCHQLTHIIGRTAFEKYGGLSGAFERGDSFCWSGFHHGAVEQAVGDMGIAQIKAEANDLCRELAEKNRYSFDHFNCVHGLGHGFMSIDAYELPNALKSCEILTDTWERDSCAGGVFMENVMVASRENGVSKYLKKDDLLYPCNGIEETFMQQCYLMQSSYMLQQNGYNFRDTFALCQKADSAYINTCFQSIGRDASGSSVSDVTLTKEKCDTAPDREALKYCMMGAVRDFVSYFHSDTQARELCKAWGAEIEQPCNDEITNYYRVF